MKNSQRNLGTMLKIYDKYYAFDLGKMCDFISERTNKEIKENEILETFDYSKDSDNKLSAKTVREAKTGVNGHENIVYDMLKIFIIQVVAYDDPESMDFDDLPFGTKLAFNTLIKEGFLYEL